MERGQLVVFAVVLAALALFGLKVWSDRTNEDALTSGGRTVGDQARLNDGTTDYEDGAGGGARGGRAAGRLGDRNPLRPDGSRGTGADRGSESGRGAGVAGSGRQLGGGFARAGGVGSGDGTGSGGSGGGVVGGGGGVSGGEGGSLGQEQKARKENLVDFLSSQPSNVPQEEIKQDGEEGTTLKLESTADIGRHGGVDDQVSDSQEGDGVEIGKDGTMQFPNNVNPDAAKFDITVKPNWNGADQTDNALIQLHGEHEWANRVELVKNGEFLRFIVTDNTGVESDISYRINDWQAGDEHNIQAQYGPCESNPGNCTIMYVDGRKVGERQYSGTLNFPQNIPLFVGSGWKTGAYGGADGKVKVNISSPTS